MTMTRTAPLWGVLAVAWLSGGLATPAAGAPARVDHLRDDGGLRQGHLRRRPAQVDVRRVLYGDGHRGPRQEQGRHLRPRGAGRARQGQHRRPQGLRLLHVPGARRPGDQGRRRARLLARAQGRRAVPHLHAALCQPRAGGGQGLDDLRSTIRPISSPSSPPRPIPPSSARARPRAARPRSAPPGNSRAKAPALDSAAVRSSAPSASASARPSWWNATAHDRCRGYSCRSSCWPRSCCSARPCSPSSRRPRRARSACRRRARSSTARPVPTAQPAGPVQRAQAWVLEKQAQFNRELAAAVRGLKTARPAQRHAAAGGAQLRLRRAACGGPRPRQGRHILLCAGRRAHGAARHPAGVPGRTDPGAVGAASWSACWCWCCAPRACRSAPWRPGSRRRAGHWWPWSASGCSTISCARPSARRMRTPGIITITPTIIMTSWRARAFPCARRAPAQARRRPRRQL